MSERKLREPAECPFCGAFGCTEQGCLDCGAGPKPIKLAEFPKSPDCGEEAAKEKIARAAVKYDEEVWSVEVPGRHNNAIRAHYKVRGRWRGLRPVQGFVTTTGRFVDRIEAAKLAVESGQIEALRWPPNLFSEDLW